MNKLSWKEISRENIFSKFGRGVDKVVYEMPDSTHKDFYIKMEKSASCVLALTPENKVLIVRQYRPGPAQVLNELPGGIIDKNDVTPEVTVKKELLEETGYSGDIEFVTICLDDAYSSIVRYCFVAKNCKKISDASLDEEEFIELDLISLEDFRKLLRSGQMTDVEVGYLGLDYLGLL